MVPREKSYCMPLYCPTSIFFFGKEYVLKERQKKTEFKFDSTLSQLDKG